MQGKQKIILISGLAGGISEIIWLFLWSLSSDLHLSKLAHQVTMSVFPFIKDHSFSILLGLLIHLFLSLFISFIFVNRFWNPYLSSRGKLLTFGSGGIALFLIWWMNYFIMVPFLNPHLLTLLPLYVTLISKLLFGLSMSLILSLDLKKN